MTFIHSLTPLLIAQPRNAVGGEAVRLLHVGKMSAVEGLGAGGGALQVFPPTGDSWKQKSVFVFISLSKKGKGHLSS